MSQDLKATQSPPLTWIEEEAPRLQPGRIVSADRKRALPLAGLEIKTRVLEGVSDTDMIQRFENPYDTPIEAVYTFPLPGAAAVYAFSLKVGERIVSGKVQERQAARAAYQQALDQGHRAALMEQERDDVFTMQVGNLPAGESIEVHLSFCQQLDFREEGLFELRLPTVVAPRYIPGAVKESDDTGLGVESDTDIVPDASRITPPRLAPGFDPNVDFKLSVELMLPKGESLGALASSQHIVETSLSAERVLIELSREHERLNRDFVLRWRSGSAVLSSRLSTVKGPEGESYGLLQLVAPAAAALLETGRDVIFLVDRSGSMGDYKMASASQACSLLLDSMGPRDRYAVLAFDDQMEWLEPTSVWQSADEAGRALGHGFLSKIDSRGGTELFEAIQQSLQKVRVRGENPRNAPILVVLTDGQVGDESRILKSIQQELGEAVVYTIGIDTALNDSFLTRLARLGGGTSVSVSPGEKLTAALKQIAGEIGYPALWDLEAGLSEYAPDPLPDLYQGRSLSVFFKGPAPDVLKAQGAKGAVKLPLTAQAVDFPALPRLWAKARIQALEDQFRLASYDADKKQQLKEAMIALSTEHQLLCRFTAWLAVDSAEVIAGHEDRTQIVQPVEMPDAWSMNMAGGGGAGMPPMAAPPPPPIMMAAPMPMPMPAAPMPQAMPSMARKRAMPPGGASRSQSTGILQDSTGFGSAADDTADAEIQAPAKKEQGFFEKLKSIVSPAKQAASPASPASYEGARSEEALYEQSAPEAVASESQPEETLTAQVREFLSSLETALTAADKGETVLVDKLSEQREKLLEALADSDRADSLPALQRLLRQDASRLIRALQAGSSEGLEPLIARCREQLVKVRAEQGVSATAGATSTAGAFWEDTI